MGFVAFQDTSLERDLTWVCFCLTAIRAKALRMFVFGVYRLLALLFFTLNSTHFLELVLESAEANSCWVKRLKSNPLNSAPNSFWRSKSQSYFSLWALTGTSHKIMGWSLKKDWRVKISRFTSWYGIFWNSVVHLLCRNVRRWCKLFNLLVLIIVPERHWAVNFLISAAVN
jgi:hypothetical protein